MNKKRGIKEKEVAMKRFKVVIACSVCCIMLGSMTGLSSDLDIQELRSAIRTGITEEQHAEEQHAIKAKTQNKNFLKSIFKKRTVPIKEREKQNRVQVFRDKKRELFLQNWNDFLYQVNPTSLIVQAYTSQKSLMPFMDFYINSLENQLEAKETLGEKSEYVIAKNTQSIINLRIFFTQILHAASYIYSIDFFMALTDKEKALTNYYVDLALNALTKYLGESDSLLVLVKNYLDALQTFSDEVDQEKIESFKEKQNTLVAEISKRLKQLKSETESESKAKVEIVFEKDFLDILFYYCMFLKKNMVPHLQEIVSQKDNSDILLQTLKENALISEQKQFESVSADVFLDAVLVAPEYIALIKNIQLCLSALSKGAIIAAQDAIDKEVVLGGLEMLSLDQMIDVLQSDPTAPTDYLDLIKKLVTNLKSKPLELLTFKDLQKMQRLIAKKIEENPLRPEWKSFADKRKLFLHSYVAYLNAVILPLIQSNLKKREATPSFYQRFLQFWKNKKKDFEG